MITDIEGREINAGDELILTRGSRVIRCKVERFTKAQIHLRFMTQTNTWSNYTFYVNKGGHSAKMYKIC
jgi:hypothetical protein